MNYRTEWLNKRAAELSAQLTKEALEAGAIDSVHAVFCDLQIMYSTPTQKKIEDLKSEFGYEEVIIYPEGLSAAKKGDSCCCWFHILPDGTPAYEGRYLSAGPFVRGYALVSTVFGYRANPHFHYIYPNGKWLHFYPKDFMWASPYSEDGVAQVIMDFGDKPICWIDLAGNFVEKPKV